MEPPNAPPPLSPPNNTSSLVITVALAVVLVLLSGLFSGLNLGLMACTDDDLGIIIDGSEDKLEVRYAKMIRPLRKRGNLLLATLVLGCTLINAVVAVLLADLADGVTGTIITTGAIVIFAEILPQSICSRYGLAVGAYSLPFVYLFLIVTLPLTLPLSLVLDWVLGREVTSVYTRKSLLALIKLNVNDPAHASLSGLTKADGQLITGALTYKDKMVGDVMTPLANAFTLPLDMMLTHEAMSTILKEGHTRIPVHENTKANIVAILFAKDLIGIGVGDGLPLADVLEAFHARDRVSKVHMDEKLNVALERCQKEHMHMLIVTEYPIPEEQEGSDATASVQPGIGIVTMEDFIEEILQEEIVDESDTYYNNEQSGSAARAKLQWASAQSREHVGSVGSAAKLAMRAERRKLVKQNSRKYDATSLIRKLTTTSGSLVA